MKPRSASSQPAKSLALLALFAATQASFAVQGYALGERLKPDSTAARAGGVAYVNLSWDELLPRDWNPGKAMDVASLRALQDSDPRAQQALDQLRKLWDNAPVRQDVDGKQVRLTGFLVPLDVAGGPLYEFLLVPYFGACIHTPPPPANQVVHVVLEQPVSGFFVEDAVSVAGVMEVARSETGLGNAGYRMRGRQVLHYRR